MVKVFETVLADGSVRNISEGVKISLFDINNPDAPIQVDSITKLNGYTVEYDHRALGVLNLDGAYRFAIPLSDTIPVTARYVRLNIPRIQVC